MCMAGARTGVIARSLCRCPCDVCMLCRLWLFSTMGSYNEVALSVTHQTRETLYPQCIVRVLHDAGELTSLQIVEFAWHFPNLFQQHIKLNPRSAATTRG